ncbi:hypothetical protein AQUCO_03800116v1 [Aquilegia coerulea]|uniref:F-box domain-containing protein n=1 Tax=Aquilegia coerulea TaxID=218851 RepID=A0A2G5CSM2_AQUCA|nr:hypothetical protein AQUCO_03800116v1 [Aquilegia coerulea]
MAGKISDLPDEILSFILLFLTMKEAARTGILSRRWKSVWKTSVSSSPSICLDVLTMRGSDYPKEFFGDYMSIQHHGGSILLERRKFVKFADQILQLDHRPVKDLFKLRFYLRKDYAHHIDRWIKMAIAKRCQKFDIDLSHVHTMGKYYQQDEDLYMFPITLFTKETGSSVKCLSLKSCIFKSHDINIFSSLIDLQLEYVLIDKASIVSILCNCLNLEYLFIGSCQRLLGLEICGPSLKLKHMTVLFCHDLKKIKIEANKLTRLQYSGNPVKFVFLKVPQLSNVIIRTERGRSCGALSYALGKLSSDLPKLKSLILSVVPLEEKKIPRQLPLFTNLRKLVLSVSTRGGTLWGFIPLLQASPYLRKLELHLSVWVHEHETGLMEMPSDSPHVHLKEIMLSGFFGRPHDIEFTTYLLKNATTLKRISIFYWNLTYGHATDFWGGGSTKKVEKLAAKTTKETKEDGKCLEAPSK